MSEQQLPNVSDEFLEKENLYTKVRKLGGRYTKLQRRKRRDEVYRLHFEHHYPAVKIAHLMQRNRHTISADIEYWNERLASEWNKIDVHARCMRQLQSLELQKDRLADLIDKAEKISEKISLERLILEIDDRTIKLITQANKTEEKTRHDAISMLNKFAQNNGLEHRFVDQYSLLKVPEEQLQKIQKVLRDES